MQNIAENKRRQRVSESTYLKLPPYKHTSLNDKFPVKLFLNSVK
jgi:hypothetical protein